ncbi:MAG: outer membrane beta-barrel family protein [Flavobacteriaceae bacterium]|nr:outer membrane beta-barrel family protein [Flavobacteriaceae bacterium]MDG2498462.1 outer membrane beta-barrel family protein [Flavobacteriaceae bacterium]
MKNIAVLLTFLMFSHLALFAHNILDESSISGRVIDSKSTEPLAFVNIIIKSQSGELITGVITDQDGVFEISNIKETTFIVSIQYIGYKTINKEVTLNRDTKTLDLGTIVIEEDNTALDEVTIIAETSSIQQKVDRKVITIGKDLAASGTASELMVGIPSVSVDPQTGDISLRGNTNVRVMVDGKLSNIPTAQLLKQIPSTAIKSIELITNPSAKYNPEGMSGLINIILHKNTMLGFNGNLSMGLAYERTAKFNSALTTNYRNGKLNVYANYSNNISENKNHGNINRPENNSKQLFSFNDNTKNHLIKFGVDYYINEKHTLSIFTNQNTSDYKNDGESNAIYVNNHSLDQTQLWLDKGDNSTSQYNFDYKINFDDDGHNIEFEIDHNTYSSNGIADFSYPVGSSTDYIDLNKTNRKRTILNLDYANPFNENSKIELGLQANLFNSLIGYASTGDTYDISGSLVPTPSSDFDYTRNIYSLYGNYNKKIDKWSYQLGLRLENVNVNALEIKTSQPLNNSSETAFSNDYFEFYPSAYITYEPSEKNSFQINYSRRIDRPGIGQVNPIKEWSTPLISSYGNINLRPQFTNSMEFNYTRNIKGGSVTFGTFYRKISNEINRALFIDRSDVNSGRIILTHDNFDNSTAHGVELSSSYKPTKWWSLNGSFDLYSQTLKGIAERLETPLETAVVNDIVTEIKTVDNIVWNFRLYNSFKVSKRVNLTAFGFYRGANSNLQFNVKPMYFVNIGSRVSFLDGKGSVSLNYNDILNTMKFGFDGSSPYIQEGEFNWESNTIYLGLTYRFGNTKYSAKSRKNRANDEKSSGGFM